MQEYIKPPTSTKPEDAVKASPRWSVRTLIYSIGWEHKPMHPYEQGLVTVQPGMWNDMTLRYYITTQIATALRGWPRDYPNRHRHNGWSPYSKGKYKW